MLDIVNNTAEANVTETKVLDGVELVLNSFEDHFESPEFDKKNVSGAPFDAIVKQLRFHAQKLHNQNPKKSKQAKDSADMIEAATAAADALMHTQQDFSIYANTQQDANRKKIDFLSRVFAIVSAINDDFAKVSRKSKGDFVTTFEAICDARLRDYGITFTNATSIEAKALRYATYGKLNASTEKSWAAILRNAYKVDSVRKGNVSLSVWIASMGGFASASKSSSASQSAEQAKNDRNEFIKFAKSWKNTDDTSQLHRVAHLVRTKTNHSSKASKDIREFSVSLKIADTEILEIQSSAAVEAVIKQVTRLMKEYPDTFLTKRQYQAKLEREAEAFADYREITGDDTVQREDVSV